MLRIEKTDKAPAYKINNPHKILVAWNFDATPSQAYCVMPIKLNPDFKIIKNIVLSRAVTIIVTVETQQQTDIPHPREGLMYKGD